jgi:hypothetical protein
MPIATRIRCLGLAALLTISLLGRAQTITASNVAGPGPGEVTVLDTASGATCTYTTALPRTHIGLPIAVADPGADLAITGMDVHFVSVTGQAWENVRIRVQFWEYMNPGLDPLFVGAAGPLQEVSIGARQFITRNQYLETIRFSRPITFETTSYHGLALNIQGQINGEYVDTDALTPCLRLGTPFVVGSVALTPSDYGYFRNAYGLTNFNFFQAEWRSMGSYTAMMLKLFARGPIQPRAFVPAIDR